MGYHRSFWLTLVFILIVLGLSFVLVLPASAEASVDFSLRYWARRYSLDEHKFVWLAYLESSLDPTKTGAAGEHGLTQFMPETWYWTWELMGVEEIPSFEQAFDPWLNAQAAAYMIHRGYGWLWFTYELCGLGLPTEGLGCL